MNIYGLYMGKDLSILSQQLKPDPYDNCKYDIWLIPKFEQQVILIHIVSNETTKSHTN